MDSEQKGAPMAPDKGVELAPGLWASAVVVPKLAEAMAAAQAKIGNAAKDSKNPHFGSNFASLASVLDASREALAEFGLAVLQPLRSRGGVVIVSTLLMHKSGEWLRADMDVDGCKGPQQIGSASTYLRRYGLQGMVCVASQDDDGNAAQEGGDDRGGHREERRQAPPTSSQPRQAPPASPATQKSPYAGLSSEDLLAEIGTSNSVSELEKIAVVVDKKHPLRERLNTRYREITGKAA